MVAKEKGGGGGMEREFEVGRCKQTFRMQKQYDPAVQHREIYPISWDGT